MKGWFDRVYTAGYAYEQQSGLPKMKTVKYGLIICTAGYTNKYLHDINIAQSMQNIMLNDRLGERFEHKEMMLLGGTLDIENVRQIHTEKIESVAAKIKHYCL